MKNQIHIKNTDGQQDVAQLGWLITRDEHDTWGRANDPKHVRIAVGADTAASLREDGLMEKHDSNGAPAHDDQIMYTTRMAVPPALGWSRQEAFFTLQDAVARATEWMNAAIQTIQTAE
jgi:hypothetical protein